METDTLLYDMVFDRNLINPHKFLKIFITNDFNGVIYINETFIYNSSGDNISLIENIRLITFRILK